CAIAENWVGTKPGALESPCAPHVVGVDGDAIRDSVLVVDQPERVSQRWQRWPFRYKCCSRLAVSRRPGFAAHVSTATQHRGYSNGPSVLGEEVLGDYPFRCD